MVPDPIPDSAATPGRIESPEQLSALMTMISTVQPDFDRAVSRIARSGLTALPGADGVGVAVLQGGRLSHLSDTDDFVAEVDDAQYGAMQGPCVTAALERRTVVAPSLTGPDGWPALAPQLEAAGVRSALSIPLTVQERLIGTLNVYARRPDAFDTRSAALGERFATPAAAALQRALVVRQAQRTAACLSRALAGRRIVNRAVGVLMAQDGLEAAEAHAHLEETAAARGRDLETVAQELWDERVASGRPALVDEPVPARRR